MAAHKAAGSSAQLSLRKKTQEQYHEAITLKAEEQELRKQYQLLLQETKHVETETITINREHVVSMVALLTKIPLGNLNIDERAKLANLEQEIKKLIYGQDHAIEQISGLIRRARTNVADPSRPIASFMFLGPSGVGKTETAKQLAAIYFGTKRPVIQVDMSEFSESFSISKLIGAPAGYVGYRDTNKFTDQVRQNPYSVVLLDEIEKAHPEVFNILLQILEEGSITDATGRMINFTNTIIIMTSNIGLGAFNRAARIGFTSSHEAQAHIQGTEVEVLEELKTQFRPEFLNRIDSTIVFKPLSEASCATILEQYTTLLNNRLREQNIELVIDSSARNYIVKTGFNPESGARGIRKFFQDAIESKVASLLLAKKDATQQKILVTLKKNTLDFSVS
jgi:ATP-dependent Clp protease ATP-binding subunit ClpA